MSGQYALQPQRATAWVETPLPEDEMVTIEVRTNMGTKSNGHEVRRMDTKSVRMGTMSVRMGTKSVRMGTLRLGHSIPSVLLTSAKTGIS
jgi:hypothetical protein